MQGRSAWGIGVVGAVVLVSCGSSDDELLVLAASSLADAMVEMEAAFEDGNPGVDVRISLAGTNALRTQVAEGAPADVVAFAATAPMDALVDAGDVNTPVVFATNRLVLATPDDDPGDVDALDDLADPDRKIGLCAPAVPCGALAAQLLDDAGIIPAPDTEEPDVRSLVAKLASGELDAGLVYATDAGAFPDALRIVPIDESSTIANRYPIAVTTESDDPDASRRFVEFVLSDRGSAILTEAGFGTP
ncbi:MAG: molybdate ABC transporter substrate-binding protein [Ilumatobacter sp.]